MSSLNVPSDFQCLLHLDLPAMGEINALAGALGSIIGYLGGEVAEPALFERLLWPERFYNGVSTKNLIYQALFMPMGGPLHKAALGTLDVFREKGLYGGTSHGHMLGTAFYQNTKLTYKLHGYDGPDKDCEIRNGLWATVLRQCRQHSSLRTISPPNTKGDPEAKGEKPTLVRRTTQAVLHLQLWRPASESEYSKVKTFSEDAGSVKAVIAMFASEITALACAATISAREKYPWFAGYLCIPLLLKLLSIPVSVRREPGKVDDTKIDTSSQPTGLTNTVLFEVSDYDHGFPIIEGPEPVIRQFFKHWGHPIRRNNRDRAREIAGIVLIFAFVLYFPIGLLSMLWVSPPVQVIWLSYQLYTIIAMHIMRICGTNGKGRTEEGIAQELANGNLIALKSAGGGVIMAKLESTPVERIRNGQEKVKDIVESHQKSRIKRTDSESSQNTLYSPIELSMEKL